eukprot:g26556.t1
MFAAGAVKAEKPRSAAKAGEKPATGEKTVAELTALVRKSVVVVTFAGRDGKTLGLGSGFIISPDGLIATNLHVIGEARAISVKTADGKTYPVTSIHATERRMDLAIIQIDAKNLPALPLGDSRTIRQGEKIVAIGNPRGLTYSVVSGVVSGRRTIDEKPVFQLAIPIEPGNSGGPMLDMQGRVHGILTLKSLVTRDLGFAVRINALKPLLKSPNPVPMSRWLTIGALDKRDWQPLFGANWRQRAGRVSVSGRGVGFGGRSIVLSKKSPPKLPYEVAVSIKLDDESGAAGLAFHADGNNRHYGFYPTNGKLRLSRFEGPDVYSWKVLTEIRCPQYRPNEWNTLKVRLEKGRIKCFCNGECVIESTDSAFDSGRVGLAKFRDTVAEFKRFTVAKSIPSQRPSPTRIAEIEKLVRDIGVKRPPKSKLVGSLLEQPRQTGTVLQERARNLEQQAKRLRQLAKAVHETATRKQLAKLFQAKDSDKVDLLHAALLIARIDNDEVDVAAYLRQVDRMAADVKKRFKNARTEQARLQLLDKYLFEELGYHGSRTNYYSRSNSYLNEVIDDREGLPIAVSLLYMELARRVGLKVVGVGLPGHFVVRFEPKKGKSELIDPFERGKRWTREEAIKQVETRLNRKFDEQDLVAQSPTEILIRMQRNLMGVARDANDPEAMLRYVETILVLQPDSGIDRWFRAVLNYQTSRYEEALADVDWVIQKRPAEMYDRDSERLFAMMLRTEWPSEETSIAELRERMNDIGREKGLSIRTWSRDEHDRPPRLAICTTYRPEPALAILRSIRDGRLRAEAALMVGNRQACRGVAEQFDVDWRMIGDDKGNPDNERMVELFDEFDVDYIVLARYMRILPPGTCWRFAGGRIINLHHGLLPPFPGFRPYEDAFGHHMLTYGATVHFIVPELDAGNQTIHQSTFNVFPGTPLEEIKRQGETDHEPQNGRQPVRYRQFGTNAVPFKQLMTVDRRPARVFENRTPVQRECRGDLRPDNLQEKRLVECPADQSVALDFRAAAGHHETVDHLFANRGFHRRFALVHLCVHRNRHVRVLPQKLVSADIVMRYRAFIHHDVMKLLEFLQQPGAVGGIDTEAVEVHIDFEVIGQRGTELAGLLDQIPPGAALGLKTRVAVFDRQFAFADPVVGGKIDIPPRDMAAVAHLLAQQLMQRSIHRFGGSVE